MYFFFDFEIEPMKTLKAFLQRLQAIAGSSADLDVPQARQVVSELNTYLYTNYNGLGKTVALDTAWPYFSEFHRFWEQYHRKILNLKVSQRACKAVADALHDVYLRTNGEAFSSVYDTMGLSPQNICRVRMLTANQDFRGSRSFRELAEKFNDDPTRFQERNIAQDPESFIRLIDAGSLSQSDKRIQYAKNIAKFLLEHHSAPFGIIDCFGRDVYDLRQALVNYTGAGYGNKKADMFIRDMWVLGVWKDVRGFEKIDVASDVNTIKVALRTGILTSEIPLVSSFLDIFCHQYGYVDEMNAAAWRSVWENWNKNYPREAIASPSLLDYFVYNVVGRQFCKESLCIFEGNGCGHQFRWASGQNKTCQICAGEGIDNRASVVRKVLPCEDDMGHIAIERTEFYRRGIANPNLTACPFKPICDKVGHKQLQPPKSISIMGRTGWTTAYADREAGGGGLMA